MSCFLRTNYYLFKNNFKSCTYGCVYIVAVKKATIEATVYHQSIGISFKKFKSAFKTSPSKSSKILFCSEKFCLTSSIRI